MKIDFYFDPISPYVWLSFYEIEKLKREFDVVINPIPTLFGGLLDLTQNKGPAEVAAKRRYYWMDVIRWSKELGVEFNSPPEHPFNPLLVLRIAEAISDLDQRYKFAFLAAENAWRYGKDITKVETVKPLLQKLNLNAEKLLSEAESKAIKEKVKQNTLQAAKNGAFGVPTFIADGELFWGQDRMHFIKKFLLTKERVDMESLDEFLNRPRGIDRPFWAQVTMKGILEQCDSLGIEPRAYLNYFLDQYQNGTEIKAPKDWRRGG